MVPLFNNYQFDFVCILISLKLRMHLNDGILRLIASVLSHKFMTYLRIDSALD
jgi:hypothetical protein